MIKLWFLRPEFDEEGNIVDPDGLLKNPLENFQRNAYHRAKNLALLRAFLIIRVPIYMMVLVNM